jgi:hypothetical protein
MSVGGRVVEVIDTGSRIWVNTREPKSGDECAIWQGDNAYWTPRAGSFRNDPPWQDKKLRRTSGSGVARPAQEASDESN